MENSKHQGMRDREWKAFELEDISQLENQQVWDREQVCVEVCQVKHTAGSESTVSTLVHPEKHGEALPAHSLQVAS